MSYFSKPSEMLAEAEALILEAAAESEDEATLSGFYNGRALGSNDAGHSGVVANHLMGYDSMNDARLSLEGVYMRQKLPWKVKLSNVPVAARQQWEMIIQDEFCKVVRKSKRLKPEWKGMCGSVTLMGRACLVWTDTYDWCPRHMNPLVPRRTGTLTDSVPYAVIPSSYTLKQLKEYLDMAKGNPDTMWKIDALTATIDTLSKNIGTRLVPGTQAPGDKVTAAESADAAGAGGWGPSVRASVLVFHIYENCQEETGAKYVKHTIIARHDADVRARWTEATGNNTMPVVFYENENFADCADQWLRPYFIDTKIGKTSTWHNVMGLGRLNYDADVETEVFMNEAMEGSRENLRRNYTCADGSDVETLQQFLSGDNRSNIMPAGLQVADTAKNSNFPYAIQVMQLLQKVTTGHAKSSIPNAADGTSKELEVQAIERQGRNAISLASRMEDFYDDTDALGMEILRRFITIDPLPTDVAYHEITAFQDALKSFKIPLAKLREKGKDGKLKNLEVFTNRSMGQGDRVSEIMVNRMLMQRLQLFSPQAQQMILRRITAVETGDHELANELVPDRPKVDPRQTERANSENQACAMRGLTNYIPQLNDDDMQMYHIQEHMGGLEGLLAKGQAQGWEPVDVGAFKSLGAHTMLHVQHIQNDPEQKNTARQIMGRLQEMGSQADQFTKALQQKQQQEEIPAGERARLQQKQEQIELSKEKEKNVVHNREQQLLLKQKELTGKEVKAGADIDLKQRQLSNEEFKTDSQNAIAISGQLNDITKDSSMPTAAP